MSRFKHGVSLLALEKKVPIVPIYLAGLAKIRPKGSREVFPGPVHAHVQRPIYLPDDIDVPSATRMIYDSLNAPHSRVQKLGDEAGRFDYDH